MDNQIVVTATQTANDGTNATYSVSVSNTYSDGVSGWAVFDGATNIRNGYNAGTFSVPVGRSYTVFGAAGAGGQGSKSIVISPAAPPPPVDTTAPVVSITSPANGVTVAGLVALTANATDAMSGVNRVEFRVDGTLVGTDATAPYTGLWDSATAIPGTHVIEAKAFDNVGLFSASSVQVSIASPPPPPPVDTTAPVVGITSPANGATVAGSVAIAASATDNLSGVARVEFRVDGTLVGSDATAPYAASWNAVAAAPGTHVIEATAFDNVGLSSATSIQVSIATPPPPPVALTSALTVNVKTLAGAAVGGAKIVVKNTATGVRYSGVTSAAGTAQFGALPYGNYSVLASGRGYKRATTALLADAAAETLAITLIAR